jgi:hypothetical protein
LKIKKLEKHNGRYELAEVPEKINEIIELLNNSFLTREHDDEAIVDVMDSLTTISCDRLTPSSNETTCGLTVDHLLNMVEGAGSIYDNIKCPKCGAKYFEVGASYCTAVYYPPIIKDGVNVNPDHNKSVTTYTCCECGHVWEE